MVKWAFDPKNIFYFCGNVGTGKTYFAAAFYNFLIEQKKPVRVYSEQFLFNELKVCMNLEDWGPTYRLQVICEAEYLILDDLGSSKMTEWQKEMLFYLVDTRYNNELPTLITSNLTKDNLKQTFHERMVSRLYATKNTIIELDGRDRRQDPIKETKSPEGNAKL